MNIRNLWLTVRATLILALPGLPSGALAASPWGPMEQIEAAARKEGALVIYAAPGHFNRESQREISNIFKDRYGVTIEWTGLSASDISPRVFAEQRTKQYTADITMSGVAGHYGSLKPKGYVSPIVAPSSLEKGVWRLDPAVATPNDRDWLFINMPLRPSILINTKMIPAGQEPRSYQDLLDPKWKGKIAFQSPAGGGTGSGWFRATYRTLGLDYMRKLAKQVVLVAKVNDPPQALAQGRFPVALAATTTRTRQLIEQGASLRFIQPKEGNHMASQGTCFIANAPHANAAMLFYQWFFSKEGQLVYATYTRAISVRKDVPQGFIPEDERYVEGEPFLMAATEDQQGKRPQELLKLGKEIFVEGK
ncbi:MAG TPA: extracellular solute-binding protein [Candidatus Binatia bacterium]